MRLFNKKLNGQPHGGEEKNRRLPNSVTLSWQKKYVPDIVRIYAAEVNFDLLEESGDH